MSYINKFTKSINNLFEIIAKAKMQSALLAMGREWVEENGYSYKALEQGLSAWPWRKTPSVMIDEKSVALSVRELNSYTDRQLTDIGIDRRNIETAVRFGREGHAADIDQRQVA